MDRISKLQLIEDQAHLLGTLKNKLSIKIPCRNNAGYDFIPVESVENAINWPVGFPVGLKNSEGKTFTEEMEKLNESYQRLLVDFENSLLKQVNEMYKNIKDTVNA